MTTSEREARFHTLVNAHKRILYKVCNSYCANRDDRDDLAQEIVVQLWRAYDAFDARCQFSTWMYRIALNVAISFCRQESARTRHFPAADGRLLETVEETTTPPEELLALHQYLASLDALNKALMLLYLDGYRYTEIADVLGISATNVATRISRLKKKMQQEIGADEEAGTGKDFDNGTG